MNVHPPERADINGLLEGGGSPAVLSPAKKDLAAKVPGLPSKGAARQVQDLHRIAIWADAHLEIQVIRLPEISGLPRHGDHDAPQLPHVFRQLPEAFRELIVRDQIRHFDAGDFLPEAGGKDVFHHAFPVRQETRGDGLPIGQGDGT